MAKRRAAVQDSDSQNDNENEGTHAASKRARKQDGSDDEGDSAGPSTTQGRRRTAKSQADDPDSDSDGQSEIVIPVGLDDDQFEERHTDKVRQSLNKKRGTQKGIAEYGIIQAIHMQDFMCHQKLSFKFGPQINFIIGHNGSGKSAVLSALTIALGGKTNSTGRGTGLKSFIREGQQWSEISIRIKNEGPEAYRPTEYGPSIVIVRRFSRDGGSSWKMQNGDTGRTVSAKREEVSAICDHMNIQVDNPLNVLTQDSARQFLSASAPGDKYKFFLLGTQLFQLSTEYDICLSNIQKTFQILAGKFSALPDLRAAYREAQRKLKEAEQAREQKRRVDELKKEMAWAHVAVKKAELEDKWKEKARLEEKTMPKYREGLRMAEIAVEEASARIAALEQQVANLGDIDSLTHQKSEIQNEIKENRAKLADFNSDIRKMNTTIKTLNGQIERTDAKIAEEEEKMQAQTQARKDDLQQQIQTQQESLSSAEDLLTSIGQQKKELLQAITLCETRGRELEGQRKELELEGRRYEGLAGEARKAGSDVYVPYGKDIANVVRKVGRCTWKGEQPIGPLGVFVKARDPKMWGDLLRTQLGGYLNAFVVTDPRDRPQLKKLLDEGHNRNMIIIQQRDIFDYSSGEPDSRYLTVLRALEISDPFVKRVLINQASIERVLLNKSRKDVEMDLRQIGGGVGWADVGNGGFIVRVYGEGGIVSTPFKIRRGGSLLLTGRDNKAEVRHHEAEVERVRQEITVLDQEYQHCRNEYASRRRELDALTGPESKTRHEATKARAELSGLQQQMNDDLPTSIAAFQQARDEYVSDKANVTMQAEDVIRKKAGVDQAQAGLQERLDDLKRRIKEFEQEKGGFAAHIQEAAVERAQKQANVGHYKTKIAETEQELAAANESAATVETEFTSWTESALKFCEEVPNPRAVKIIDRELEGVQTALKERERRHGASVDEMVLEVNRTRDAHDKAAGEYKQTAELNKALKASLVVRLARWQEFRRHIALRTKLIFQYHLSQRGYFGKVMFNHVAQTLMLKVQTDDQAGTQGGSAEKDPRSLSGGEKSFSTICLLLSLWDSIGCPLRCLDEFDVFMDAVNRRISMKMMIDTANSSPDKQYILITPQDMTNIRIEDNVKVHRMNDPQRGGGALRFGAVASNDT
ncbi:P-loop containing nucleoside triphosphate hydrolase protein [Coprinopsis marcescibilis]|uniref:P-loop containing nucleoside triphosphate hydrolase protein n=1 Tax=Coprinopsis marcescibilis TaxID=230819 RepID=A0A5C3L2B1_COPMA|nr:P-loop containing nucleoside triphosphate hydrolase protein [Coprinopsis marcescibilis]